MFNYRYSFCYHNNHENKTKRNKIYASNKQKQTNVISHYIVAQRILPNDREVLRFCRNSSEIPFLLFFNLFVNIYACINTKAGIMTTYVYRCGWKNVLVCMYFALCNKHVLCVYFTVYNIHCTKSGKVK